MGIESVDASGADLAQLLLQHRGAALLHRYQRLVDAKDLAGLADLVTDEVLLERQDGIRRGREGFLDLYRAFASSDVQVAQHLVSNIEVTAVEAERPTARIDSGFVAFTTHGSGEARVIWGRYRDEMVQVEDRWLLSAKRISVVRTVFVEESAMAPVEMDSFGARPR